MKYIEKHPIIMIAVGVMGISLSSIFVKYSTAPSAVTAAYRLIWTILLMSPVTFGKQEIRKELFHVSPRNMMLSCLSGIFLAFHFTLWFESLKHTSVASSTTIVCTEVIWVALGFCLFLKGRLLKKAMLAIEITFAGSLLIAYADSSAGGVHLYGDFLALVAAIAVAVYTLIGRIVRKNVSTNVYTYVVYSSCALVLLLTCLVQGYRLFDYGMSAVIVGLLLSVFSTILGHSIFSWCLKYFSPAFVSASKLCEPVVAAIFAGFLFGEVPAITVFAGGAMILGGVLYYSKIEREI
jgi:drug/metabolite transporter (DMT)-like permease